MIYTKKELNLKVNLSLEIQKIIMNSDIEITHDQARKIGEQKSKEIIESVRIWQLVNETDITKIRENES